KKEINEFQKHIDKTDNEIDQMVYDLYGLTKEEIEIVEGK
ncbi:MAG: restriction endonuclease, partial [Candidatus Cloacimonetes bacterium]|nr:restriction endonuclease [Candidatus Cloacimonadota bacterium]